MAILQSSYRFLQVTSNWKTLKKTCLFLRAVKVWPTLTFTLA